MGLGESAATGTGCISGLGWLCGLAEKVGSAYTSYTEQTRADSVQACQDPKNADAINCRIIDGSFELAETLPTLAIDSAPMLAGVIGGANEIADMAAQKALNNRATSQSSGNGARLAEDLATQEHISIVNGQKVEAGKIMAGGPHKTRFRDSERIVNTYGGNAADWVKKTSGSSTTREGIPFETHWVENLKTGERVEFKTKYNGGQAGVWFHK